VYETGRQKFPEVHCSTDTVLRSKQTEDSDSP